MNVERSTIPKILLLKAITPAPESAGSDTLLYRKLDPAVAEHAPYEYARMSEFWDAKPESLDEHEKALQLAKQYLLMGSQALIRAGTPTSKEVWSHRYTQATSELFGTPETELARRLFADQKTSGEVDQPYRKPAEQVKEYLETKYADVYAALDLEDAPDSIDAADIADRFEAALDVLRANHDEAWGEWVFDRNEDKDSLSIIAEDKEIVVGMHRAPASPGQLKGLFAHEVLVHGLRSVNGSKLSKELGEGLPDYLEAEEGLGVFVEYAITGKISEKIIDRYVDIAYALGTIDGQPHTRQELLEHAMKRAIMRNETSTEPKSIGDIEKEVYAHVNRIYRGSLGNEHIGIFTKDIAYYQGFIDMGDYISLQLDSGKTVEEIMEYLTIGKFDPMNARHIEVLP